MNEIGGIAIDIGKIFKVRGTISFYFFLFIYFDNKKIGPAKAVGKKEQTVQNPLQKIFYKLYRVL